jgi:hypothetical protein
VQYFTEKHPQYALPSKALSDGRTPLLLAIIHGDPSTVQLLVKAATVHDVQRCWSKAEGQPDILEILCTKVFLTRLPFSEPHLNATSIYRKDSLRRERFKSLLSP